MKSAPDHPHEPGAISSDWAGWSVLMARIEGMLGRNDLAPERLLVLLPYAQLIEPARQAWVRLRGDGFPPRFETTRNWASVLAPWMPSPTDPVGDVARDSLVAQAMVEQMLRSPRDAALKAELATRLVDAVRQLAPLASSVPPERRPVWAEGLRGALGPGPHWESMVASLALAWVGSAGFATDVLWSPTAAPGGPADRLWLLQGLQDDPLGTALALHWGPRAEVLSLADLAADPIPDAVRTLQVCDDAAEEAYRAAAVVIDRVNQGAVPVALVANDRLLTRRVSALLHGAGLAVRDETGWKLSTTRAAARLMSLLRASDSRARTDDVIDLLKQGQVWPAEQVDSLEQMARESGASSWRAVLRHPLLGTRVPAGLAELLGGLQSARPLERWLDDLRTGLAGCGLWAPLLEDPAGQQLVKVLRLQEGAGSELRQVGQALAEDGRAEQRLSRAAFTAWVRNVLEAASFLPPGDADAHVVILPMAQLLGRGFGAVVLPGCDEATLDPNPEPTGPWTMAQRTALGLRGREELAKTAVGAWRVALTAPRLDLLWRRQDGGEPLSPSPWVLALPEYPAGAMATANALRERLEEPQPTAAPEPVAPHLVPATLSASAYQDLRDCPYRFFALRQLRLAEAAELEAEPDQRDLGNWLHAVLRRFHEQRADQRPGRAADTRRLDEIGDAVALEMGLDTADGEAGFLPFLAVWPALREGYLDWLYRYEATPERPGPRFVQGEAERSAELPPWRLWGKLDRIDEQDSPEGRLPVVIDYKTESRQKTEQRVKNALEDTQLAFYAALLPQDNLRAGYLSITDGRSATSSKPATHLYEQALVVAARDRLREGLVHDLSRVAAGHPMPALGEGAVCEHCAARGLCRKDFWSPA